MKKRIVAIGLMLLVLMTSVSANEKGDKHPTPQRPKVAVVLSGGGAKGVAHIGALKVIEEAGIPIDMVCGTSMGALMGGLYCIGYTPDELDSLVRAQEWTFLLTDRKNLSLLNLTEKEKRYTYALHRELHFGGRDNGGVIRGTNLSVLFDRLCYGFRDSIDFNQLPIPFACVATDVVEFSEVVFHSGWLPVAMRASMAIPGVFTPVRIHNQVLVDGGLSNNIPVDIAKEMGADIVIGVSVQEDLMKADGLNDAFSILGQIVEHECRDKYVANLAACDVAIRVDVKGYTSASFTQDALDTLMRHGREAALAQWDKLLSIAQQTGRDTTQRPPSPLKREIAEENRPVHQSRQPSVAVGFRFDNEERGSLQFEGDIPFRLGVPSEADITLRLGERIKASVDYTLFPRGFTSPRLSYTFQSNDIDIYTNGKRTHNALYRQHSVDLLPLFFRWHRYNVKIGLTWDYYNYYGGILSSYPIPYDITDDHYLSYQFSMQQNSENHWYFPSHGMRMSLSYAYRTSSPIEFNHTSGLSDLSGHWRVNIPLSSRLTLQPMVYGRIMMGDHIPLAFSNAVGSEWFGHYVEQQMPFAGVGNVEYVDNQFVAAQLQTQYRIARNHYVLFRIATAINTVELEDIIRLPNLLGIQMGYSYNTLLGPIDLRLGWSNRTKALDLFLNFGYAF